MEVFFDYFVRFMTCISPIVVGWFGIQANRNSKKQAEYIQAQEDLKAANEELKVKEKKELEEHFKKIDGSITKLTKQVAKLETSIGKISEIDKRINNLVEMSNINFEFCTSLSAVISSIGNALDSSDAIESGTLQADLAEHKKHETALLNRMCKIVY